MCSHTHTHTCIQGIVESRDNLSFLTKPKKAFISRAHPNKSNLSESIVKNTFSPMGFPD